MNYTNFKNGLADNSINATIDQTKVLSLTKYLPANYQAAHIFWSSITLLSIPVFILLAVFFNTWIGLLLLIIGSPMLFRATKKSATQFLIRYALENEEFFMALEEKQLIICQTK